MNCCNDIAEKLLQFRDGTLPEAEMEHLREHLHYCPTCLYLLNGYDEVIDVLDRLKPVNMPADLCERMKQCLHEELDLEAKQGLGMCGEPAAGADPAPEPDEGQ